MPLTGFIGAINRHNKLYTPLVKTQAAAFLPLLVLVLQIMCAGNHQQHSILFLSSINASAF
jgi:hypothetical protein